MRRWVVAPVLALVVAVALVSAVPGALGLAGWTPMAQVVPFRGVLAVGLLAVAAVLGAGGLWTRRRTGALPVVRLTAAGLLLAAVAHAGVLLVRGVDPTAAASRGDGDLVVLSLNTEHGGASAQQVAEAAVRADADVVALPETPASMAQDVADLVATSPERPRTYRVLTATTSDEPTHATSLLLAGDLGAAEPAAAPAVGLAAVAAAPTGLPGPVVAAHAIAPVPWPLVRREAGMVPRWRADLPAVAAACAGAPGAVVAGDLNATLDHPGLGDLGPCVDAAAAAGAGGLGTWPATVPELAAAPIDHVLVDARTWRVVSVQVVTVGASDHRGLVVHLARRDG